MVALALDGPAAHRNRYELIHRHRAEAPNALWQADHTLLDDRSRAVAGDMVFLGAPCALNTCLALRHTFEERQKVKSVPNRLRHRKPQTNRRFMVRSQRAARNPLPPGSSDCRVLPPPDP